MQQAPEAVADSYCERIGGKLKIRCGEDGYCVFFRQGSGCGVHEGKPSICRAWPFFRGNIEDPASLAMAKEFCPGIETARCMRILRAKAATICAKTACLLLMPPVKPMRLS